MKTPLTSLKNEGHFMLFIFLLFIAIICTLLGWLYKSYLKKGKNKILTEFVSILGTIISAFSLFWAALTYYDNVQLQKSLASVNLYQEHMKLSIEHPDLANSALAQVIPPQSDTLKKNIDSELYKKEINYEKYRWYVGYTMFTFETILDVNSNDEAWNKTMGKFVKRHRSYIATDSFHCERYSEDIQKLIRDSLGENCHCPK